MTAFAASPPPMLAMHNGGPAANISNPAFASTSTTSPSLTKSSSTSNSLLLTPQIMSSFKPAKVFRDHIQQDKFYTSLSFDDKGEQVITAGEDETGQLFNCRTGKHVKQFYSKKYGVHLARFTHKSSAIIYASTKEDDTVRYLSLHDNSYIRYFKGHKRKVTSLEMSPADDTFLSGAADDTVRLWDLRSTTCAGLLNVAGAPSVAYDPSGSIFAVTLNLKSTTLLYDIRKLDVEPFAEISIADPVLAQGVWPLPRPPVYTSVKFSNDGNYLLVGTSAGIHYVLHSFNYNVVARLQGAQGLGEDIHDYGISSEETSWSPDGRYVICGSKDGNIYIYDVNPPPAELAALNRPPPGDTCTLEPIKILEGHKNTPSRVVRFNPRHAMMVSGGKGELAFWLTDIGKEGTNVEVS